MGLLFRLNQFLVIVHPLLRGSENFYKNVKWSMEINLLVKTLA